MNHMRRFAALVLALLASMPATVALSSLISRADAGDEEDLKCVARDGDGGGGWGGGGGREDWMDMIAESGCIPEMYDYYMLPDPKPSSGPSTADDTPTWAPGEDGPAVAPDNCDFYDATEDPWIYLSWGCG